MHSQLHRLVTILFAHDPLSLSAYPMVTYTHLVAGNLPIKQQIITYIPELECTLMFFGFVQVV